MGLLHVYTLGGWLFTLGLVGAQEDSLRSALNAIDRRQRDLSDYSRYDDDDLGDYGYSLESPDNLAFLSASDYNADLDRNPIVEKQLEKYLTNFLDENYVEPHARGSRDDRYKKRISSSFRERLEEDKERQLEELADNFLPTTEDDPDNDEYYNFVKEYEPKYRDMQGIYNRPRVYTNNDIHKHVYYPKMELRKRGRLIESEPTAYNYMNRYVDDDRDDINNYDLRKQGKLFRKRYDFAQKSYPMRRFPVSKRSSGYEPTHAEQKRSMNKKETVEKTEPKVVKDLSNVFGTISTDKPTTTPPPKKETKQKTKPTKAEKTKTENKEHSSAVALEKPLDIKKKSINWSDYFGIDRRKKSDDLDGEWLMERYHKAIALTNKRSADYPLQSFKNHDPPAKKVSKQGQITDDEKISDMDVKLKSMEDTLIDDALKYTGAHQGMSDSQEIQDVKDRVISRLAAAYSLEKMRRALGEYKLSIAKERQKIKQPKTTDDFDVTEDKRVSVGRKQAIDEDREKISDGDNNIKCSEGDADCEEQNYRTPSDIIELSSGDECPLVQRACGDVACSLNNFPRVFDTACKMHQMCLICSNNSWFAPTRQCNVQFLSKVYELCDGKKECQKEAEKWIRYLGDVSRSLRLEPLGECELACADKR